MDIKTVLAGIFLIVVGIGIGSADNLSSQLPSSSENNKLPGNSGSQDSGFTEVSTRQLENNPSKWEGEKVIVRGHSNSLKDFIESDGYTVDMDCSSYSDFDFSSHRGIVIYGVVEYIPGEIPLQVRCIKAPKIQSS